MKTYLSRANAPFYLWLSSTLTSLFKLSFLYILSLVVCFALIFVCLLSSFTNPSLASFVGWTSRASELVVVSWQRSTRQMCSPLVNLQEYKTMSKQGNAATTVRLRPTGMGLHMALRLHRVCCCGILIFSIVMVVLLMCDMFLRFHHRHLRSPLGGLPSHSKAIGDWIILMTDNWLGHLKKSVKAPDKWNT